MAFHVYCIDDVRRPTLRRETRAEHLAYMIAHRRHILFGGPLKAADGTTTTGSAFALDYSSQDEVDRFLRYEPYMLAGLFSEVRVSRMAVMMPEQHDGFLDEEYQRELEARAGKEA